MLSDASFDKHRKAQASYAEKLGGRLATRGENRAVATTLLQREEQRSLSPAEIRLLAIYRNNYVRDSEGRLGVGVGRVIEDCFSISAPDHYAGALFVLPLE